MPVAITTGVDTITVAAAGVNMRTLAVFIENNELVLIIPNRNYENLARLGLCIVHNIPASNTPIPVVVQFGYSSTAVRYQLLDIQGAPVMHYQIRCRRRYPLTVSTTTSSFVVHPCCLESTTAVLPTNATVAVAVARSGGKNAQA